MPGPLAAQMNGQLGANGMYPNLAAAAAAPGAGAQPHFNNWQEAAAWNKQQPGGNDNGQPSMSMTPSRPAMSMTPYRPPAAAAPAAPPPASIPTFSNQGQDQAAANIQPGMTNTPAQQGYTSALSNLQNSLNLAGNTTSGQQMALGQQLQQNQGQVQQGLINSGLGNSTIAQTMQQAPLQTYNQGMLNAQNQGALLQMGAYNNLANMAAQGGMNLNQAGYGLQKNQQTVQGGGITGGRASNQMFGGGGGQQPVYDPGSSFYGPGWGQAPVDDGSGGYGDPTAGQGQQAAAAAQAALMQSIMGQQGAAVQGDGQPTEQPQPYYDGQNYDNGSV